MSVLYLDFALRSGAAMTLVLLAILLWQAPIGWEGRLSVLAVAVSKTAFLLHDAALPLDLPAFVAANVILLASLTPNAITWLIVTIFLDPPGRRWPWLAASSITSISLYVHLTMPALWPVCFILATALYGGLLVLALWSSRDDLVECRCRARPGFAIAIAGLALILTGAQALGALREGTALLALLQSIGTLAITSAFAIWILRPDASLWPGEAEAAQTAPPPAQRMDALDTALIARIEAAMAAGIWREEGLTIGALAVKLSVPEHRLRRAINQGLGHRNFSSFINRARIEAARTQLSDPAQMSKTILEIAYDVGFASLGPFNRAFRAETGQSPSEYRRDALSRDIADSSKPLSISAHLH